jgi:hypothetical protein
MICPNCRKAGEENSLGHLKRATHWHDKCEYEGDCGCQHKVGPGWFVSKGSKAPLMRTQSP